MVERQEVGYSINNFWCMQLVSLSALTIHMQIPKKQINFFLNNHCYVVLIIYSRFWFILYFE